MPFDPFTALTSKIFGSAAIALAILVGVQRCDIERIAGERDKARQLAADTQAAFDATVAGYRAAAAEAERVQAANLARAKAEQERINDETLASYDARLADARRRLREAGAAADSGGAGGAAMPGAGAAPGRAAEASGDLLSARGTLTASERLIAAEQAIQLDELISWVQRQAGVATSPSPSAASAD
ncbi:MAG TPA: hypothetical protein PKD99_02195 [Sphingopyxis sp.]|nr:hypothetical protein [Sphingopyxis sp.]HMP43887.1 hypothetical protein [Sphingopyxis sp.]HMQ18512.1 hypothetical protein [Sphingopyxis sp.]